MDIYICIYIYIIIDIYVYNVIYIYLIIIGIITYLLYIWDIFALRTVIFWKAKI